jgi:hypothetical protein
MLRWWLPLNPPANSIVARSPIALGPGIEALLSELSKWLSQKDFFVDDRRV